MTNRNRVILGNHSVTIVPCGMDAFWGLRRSIAIPYADIDSVHADQKRYPLGFATRIGLDIGAKRVGTFFRDGEKMYFNVSGFGPSLRFELKPGADFARVVLTVQDADALAARIRERLG
ncbi:hypothetical protein ICM05_03880 [Leucobacter sp. cx-42]|uniref:hypothetical protein n=1 Tax=unclassified Leucobacter TaxID=2621730 RepID=UPI00165D7091|nr:MULTISPECIES: hypothetical protein [unclassified Leucobacter]MBC9953792.1 hypothetical protein [Leucobacter sp. cx-42]